MKKIQYVGQFGETRCGEILFEKIKDNRKLHKKLVSFYENVKQNLNILYSAPDFRNKKIFRESYKRVARIRLHTDIVVDNPEKEDILKRMSYLISTL